jgi:nucleotide-binding universal stress UspA family protein
VSDPGAIVLDMNQTTTRSSGSLRPVLVAVGDGDEREAALDHAADAAVRERRRLQLVHVVHPAVGVGVPATTLVTSQVARLVGEGLVERAAQHVRARTEGRVPVQAMVREGDVVDVLLAIGRHADRVVLQHPRQSRVQRVLTGSVAIGVGATSSVPVVSVPECWTAPERGDRRITVGVHEFAPDAALLDRAFDTAAATGSSLTVLHAWFLPSAYDDACVDRTAVRSWVAATTGLLERNLTRWRSAHPDIEVRVEVRHERPADALLAASRGSDLLLLGRRDQAHPSPRLGSLTGAMLRESLCPVEVVPVPGRTGPGGHTAPRPAAEQLAAAPLSPQT